MDGNKPKILIVNGFYRVAGPAVMEDSKYNGFSNTIDPGIPDKYDLSYTGNQFDFDSTHQFISNDEPGWGASYSDYEAQIVAGNTFDYPYIHGSSIMAAGYSFVSASAGAIEDSLYDFSKYKIIDLILGEQKYTDLSKGSPAFKARETYKTFPVSLQKAIEKYIGMGGNLFISGSYIGSDLFNRKKADSTDIKFASNILKYKLDADHASKNGDVYSVDSGILGGIKNINFNTVMNDSLYTVQAPDAIKNYGGSKIILRYSENNFPAAIAYKGNYSIIAMGFPFEALTNEAVRNNLMKDIVNFLIK